MANEFKNKNEFKEEFQRRIIERYGRSFEQAHITEKYMILGEMVRDYASIHWNASKNVIAEKQEKQMYYFSMEFLMGRLLTNNLMNLGIYEIAKEGLAELGISTSWRIWKAMQVWEMEAWDVWQPVSSIHLPA